MDRGASWTSVGLGRVRHDWSDPAHNALSSTSRLSCYSCPEEFSLQSFQNYRTWKFILNQYCCSSTVTAESNFIFISGHFLRWLNTIVCECVYMRVCAQSLCRAWLFTTPWTVAHQAPLSVGFSGQEQWSGLPFPSPGDLPDPGIESASPVSLTLAGHKSFHCAIREASC